MPAKKRKPAKLKKCPFCGGVRVKVHEKKSRAADGSAKYSFYARCNDCRARGPAFVCIGRKNEKWRIVAEAAWDKVARLAEVKP